MVFKSNVNIENKDITDNHYLLIFISKVLPMVALQGGFIIIPLSDKMCITFQHLSVFLICLMSCIWSRSFKRNDFMFYLGIIIHKTRIVYYQMKPAKLILCRYTLSVFTHSNCQCLSTYACLSVCLPVSMYVCLPVYQSVCLSVKSPSLHTRLSIITLWVYLSVSLLVLYHIILYVIICDN